MSWGYKILIVYGIFITGIVSLVVLSSMQNRDLVTQDYYNEELLFQHKIDETNNAIALSARFRVAKQQDTLWIMLPAEMSGKKVSADVQLYAPADKAKDIQHHADTSAGRFGVQLPAHTRGVFRVKISWQADGLRYYDERKIFIA